MLIYENLNPIHFRDYSPTIELGETFDPKANIRTVFLGSKDDVQVSGYVNGLIPDTYEVDYLYKGRTWTVRVRVADRKAPDLQVHDVNAGLNEEVDAESFVKSCSDPSRFTISISNPDALKYVTGRRQVEITATDEYGNSVTKTAYLTRYNDTIPPISKETPTERTFVTGSGFEPQTFEFTEGSAEDYRVEVEDSNLDMNTPGTYQVRYRIWDSSSHMTTFTETITVIPAAEPSADETPVYDDEAAAPGEPETYSDEMPDASDETGDADPEEEI